MILIRFMSKKELDCYNKIGIVVSSNKDKKVRFYSEYPCDGKVHLFKCMNSIKRLFTTIPDFMVVFKTKGGTLYDEMEYCKNMSLVNDAIKTIRLTNFYVENGYSKKNFELVGVYSYKDLMDLCELRYNRRYKLPARTTERKYVNIEKSLNGYNLLKRDGEIYVDEDV